MYINANSGISLGVLMAENTRTHRRPEQSAEERIAFVLSSTPVRTDASTPREEEQKRAAEAPRALSDEERRGFEQLFETMSGRTTGQPIQATNDELAAFYRRITSGRSPEEKAEIAGLMKAYWRDFRLPIQ